jgi:hypothetical protein
MVSFTFPINGGTSASRLRADSGGQTDNKQTAINERRLPCGHKIFIIVIGASLLSLLKCERHRHQFTDEQYGIGRLLRRDNWL